MHVQAAPVPVDAAVDAAISSSGLTGVERRIEPGLVARGDPRRTEQVLINLLDNARKYGAPPVSVEAAARNGHVIVSVLDRGAGIPAERAAEVFERFAQLDQGATRTSSGVGLGLALARGYVEAQGGTIGYEALSGGGSKFTFSLPLHSD